MSPVEPSGVDARDCPKCGARGILPLAQTRGLGGTIEEPVMLCPECGQEFGTVGMTWLGIGRPPVDGDEAKLEAWADQVLDAWLGQEGGEGG